VKGSRKAALLAGALALSSITAGPSALARPAGCVVPGEQRTLEVKVKVLNKVVARGEVVRIQVRTYRPAQDDFLDLGVTMPPGTPMEPAGDTTLTVAVHSANQYRTQAMASETDSEGKRIVKMELGDHHKKGSGDVSVRAKLDHLSERPANVCVELQEGGYTEVMNALTIR
jgi:hypothetical protein